LVRVRTEIKYKIQNTKYTNTKHTNTKYTSTKYKNTKYKIQNRSDVGSIELQYMWQILLPIRTEIENCLLYFSMVASTGWSILLGQHYHLENQEFKRTFQSDLYIFKVFLEKRLTRKFLKNADKHFMNCLLTIVYREGITIDNNWTL